MDAPKCLQCVDLESETPLAQTYRVVGKAQAFKCSRCKKTLSREAFSEVEFKWRTDRAAWDAFIGEFVSKKVAKDNLDKEKAEKALKVERAKLDAIGAKK